MKGAKSYVIERSPDPPTATGWGHASVVLKSSATINGLTAGTRYWFRVAASQLQVNVKAGGATLLQRWLLFNFSYAIAEGIAPGGKPKTANPDSTLSGS